MPYEFILVETRGRVGLVTLNRPAARNALNKQLLTELVDALDAFDRDIAVGAMVITGNDEVFAAGADIKEMAGQDAVEMRAGNFISSFGRLTTLVKPVIAAVSGWALGGGCEIALACDLIVASNTAKFGQPEIVLGVIPGGGGTQRLTRALGKSLAMEIILNNRVLTAAEALQFGLANCIVPVDEYLQVALRLAEKIAARAPLAVRAAKRLINSADEASLSQGLEQERQEFYDLFGSEDRREGMQAFIEKREPRWTGG